MARPFPNTFDKDSPMSPQSGANTPISYKANVNRMKTKKWAEAKAPDYGGDDWGDDDDYDLPPPPISKPTGLRQQGQALPNAPRAEPPIVDNGKKAYGELPALPGASNSRERSNSFDANEERNFSSNTARQPSPAPPVDASGPARSFSQIAGVQASRGPSGPPPLSISTQQPPASTGLRKPSKAISPIAESPQPEVSQLGRKNTGDAPSLTSSSVYSPTPTSDTRTSGDYQARRDYSPSAAPPPLSTRDSPAPQDHGYATSHFPKRKSSLSQVTGPDVSTIMQQGQESSTSKPWTGGSNSSPGPAGPRSPTSPAKALPFIRPADIYRRAEEERQSMESGRPSMDSIMGNRNTDKSDSSGQPQLREKTSSDSLGTSSRRRTSSFGREDGTESGRRLMPMLEPVSERKSEYGFEGFNVNDQEQQHGAQSSVSHEPGFSEATKLDVEEARRQSVSPKLPDLNRMSGFGMDMFSQSTSEPPQPSFATDSDSTPRNSVIPAATSAPDADNTLRNQPSVGFRSVVHQAFDRTDDNSVPPTPASRSDSGVRRTDSESTGTTGISPIMSRVSSSAAPDHFNRDVSTTPSIPEVVNEQASPSSVVHQPQPIAPGFKPGHRRDISTPSPANGPARTPDVATPVASNQGQKAFVSDPSIASTANDDDDDEPLHPPRHNFEREDTFRPKLPGGWTSYATTERSITPSQSERDQQIIDGHSSEVPEKETMSDSTRDSGDLDMTPTTTKRSLPQSALAATLVGATVGGEALGRHDKGIRSGTPLSPNSKVVGDDNATPDAEMGNVNSPITLDPRTLPPLEKAPAETQLRPDVVNRPESAESRDAPPPLAKDTPGLDSTRDDSDHFPSFAKTSTPGFATRQGANPSQPQVLPIVTADDESQDGVNERLEDDIVRSLSPRVSEGSRLSDNFDNRSSHGGAGRESTYLPREYDNYWDSTNRAQEHIPQIAPELVGSPSTSGGLPSAGSGHIERETESIQPLNTRKVEQTNSEDGRPAIQQRFSWERSTESVPFGASGDKSVNATAASTTEPARNEQQSPIVDPAEGSDAPELSDMQHENRSSHSGRDAALLAGGAIAATGAVAAHAHNSQEPPARRLSLAEEKDPRVSSYPVSPTPPEDEHPSRNSPVETSIPLAPSTSSPITSPLTQQYTQSGPILPFSQIAAIKSPSQRIEAFDQNRHKFAALSTGLEDWMTTLKAQQPEHADVTRIWAGSNISMPSGSARSKFGKATGIAAPPTQQPYYQQYLNASSPNAPATAALRPGPSTAQSGSQQGFSPAGGKLKTQQVQAKGKELLHTAGIFGGKAGKAGKGLLAKGKSRLRGTGGDKTQIQTSPPRNEQRASWTSGPSTRDSQQSFPKLVGVDSDSRSSTMPQEQEQQRSSTPPQPQLENPIRIDTSGIIASPTSREPAHNDDNDNVRKRRESDAQPSWLLNPTPIAENESFRWDEHEHEQPPPMPAVNHQHQQFLSAPEVEERGERSSNEISFYDASEELEAGERDERSEWVMVAPEDETARESKESESETKPSILNRPRGSTIEQLSPSPTKPTRQPSPPKPTPTSTSTFLPPIRRTSTFGLGFGPRLKKPRFPIDDDGTETERSSVSMDVDVSGSEVGVVGTAVVRDVGDVRGRERDVGVGVGRPRPDSETWPVEESQVVMRRRESNKNLRDRGGNGGGDDGKGSSAHVESVQREESRKSQDSWRPNITSQTQAFSPHGIEAIRNSWDPQRPRGLSASSQTPTQRPPLTTQLKSFEQPPSSAQRYPDLFKPETPLPSAPGLHADPVVHADLPAQYYQQPIAREAAFLPRVQTSEYQLQGVGPPADEPSSARSRRSSASFFKEIGGRISRGGSRDRGSVSRSREQSLQRPRNGDYETSIASEEVKEKKKEKEKDKKPSFMKHLTRASTGVLGPPKTRESMVTHPSGSRVDLLAGRNGRRPYFDNSPVEPSPSSLMPERASTSLGMNEEPGKKKRFSGLTGFFARPGNSPSRASMPVQARGKPQAIRKVSYGEQQSLETRLSEPRKAPLPPTQRQDPNYPPSNYRPPTSPNYPTRPNNYQPLASDHYQPPSPRRVPPATDARAAGQTRNIFAVLANSNNTNTANSNNTPPPAPASTPSPDPRKEPSKTKIRRPSAAGLLNGFMSRKSQQSDRDRDESRSQGSQSQSTRSGRQALPRAQTYTDLLEREQEDNPRMQWIDEQPKRSNTWETNREPQYDTVPIPGGYSLVRGQGAVGAPTDYDPRGVNRQGQGQQQMDPRYEMWIKNQYPTTQAPVQQGYEQAVQHPYGQAVHQQYDQPQVNNPLQHHIPSPLASPSNGQPQLGAVESYDRSVSRLTNNTDNGNPSPTHSTTITLPRRHSRDLALSPARIPADQQPPYRLSLPDDEDSSPPPPISKDDELSTPLSAPTQHRVQQPVIHYPASESPPPPPPKSPQYLDTHYKPSHSHNLSADDSLSLGLNLDRSNTRATAVSAVSVMSSPGLAPDEYMSTASPSPDFERERGRRDERGTSREVGMGKRVSDAGTVKLKQTVLETPGGDNEDIYDASPRLLRIVTDEKNVRGNEVASPLSPGGKEVGSGKENVMGTAELDNTDQERYRVAREEKIFYGGGVEDGEGEGEVSMSATSYPGQEWNPYAGVAFEDGYE